MIAAVSGAGGCKKRSQASQRDASVGLTAAPAAKAAKPVEPKLAFDPLPPDAPGPAYLVDDEANLWIIDVDGSVERIELGTVDPAASGKEGTVVFEKAADAGAGETKRNPELFLTRAEDGRAYVATVGAVFRLEGKTPTIVAAWEAKDTTPFTIRIKPAPTLFVANKLAVKSTTLESRWLGSWREPSIDAPTVPSDIVVDTSGTLWISGAGDQLLALRGDAFVKMDLPKGSFALVRRLRPTAQGLHLTRSHELLRLAPGESAPTSLVPKAKVADLLGSSARGHLVVPEYITDRVFRIGEDNKPVALKSPLGGDSDELTVDSAGRVWIARNNALAVLDAKPAKKPLAVFTQGTFPKIDASIVQMAIVGAGPSTLPLAGPVRKGTLRGRIIDGEKRPLPGARVAVCPSPETFMFSGTTPCAKDSIKSVVTADDNGIYEATDLPAGPYRVSVEVSHSKWNVGRSRFIVRGGQVSDYAK
jgi:hypothetical protein